jgi:glycosyltransferase involved in cell wall biosynthesis
MSRPAHATTRMNVMHMADVTGRGGAEKVLVDLVLGLDRTRFNVSVCATRSAGNYQPLLDQAGVLTHILGRQSTWEIDKLADLIRLFRREKVHILHTHLFGSNTWGRILGRLAGVPVIIAHEHWSSKPQREIWLDKLLYRLSDRILVASKASRQVVMKAEGIPSRYITVVYNGVDVEQFAPRPDGPEVRRELGIPPHAAVVGTLGRLSADKGGQDDLLRAVASLVTAPGDVHLLVIGDGPLRAELERLSADLSIAPHVTFAGQRTGPEVGRLLGAMDMFVLPSLREAFPVALLEAMAAGLPVVATRVGGIPEVVDDEVNGLLVSPGDITTLRLGIQRLLGDKGLAARLAGAGRERVITHFSLDRMVVRVEDLYMDLISQKRRIRASLVDIRP